MILPPALLLAAALAAAVAGCSHTTPYYRADVAGQALPGEDLAFRVILIGDAGAPRPGEPVLATLKAWARRDPDRTLVAFLGDNVYEDGFSGADRRRRGAPPRPPARRPRGIARAARAVHSGQPRLGRGLRSGAGGGEGAAGVRRAPPVAG